MKKSIFFIFILSVFLLRFDLAFASDLGFSLSSTNYKVGDYISVDVFLTNNSQATNAISGKISFSNKNLSVVSLIKNDSIIKYWASDPTFSNGSGTISFEGIIPNPGFSNARGKILTIRLLAKEKGSANLSFTNGSVLANDGLASELLNLLNKIDINITDKAPVATPVKDKSIREISTYKFQADTTPPEISIPTISYTKDGFPAINFKGEDLGSGVDHYEIIIDKNSPLFIDTNLADTPYILPKNTKGSHIVILTAIDKAGNATSISIPVFFFNESIVSQIWTNNNLLTTFILLIIIICVGIWFSYIRFKILKSKMNKDLETILDTMKDDFDILRENFEIHNSSSSKSKDLKQKVDTKKIFKISKDHIDLIERDINHKIKILKDRL